MPENKSFDFKIGADPEFNLIMHNKRLHAEELFQHLLQNDKAWKKDSMGFKLAKAGNIGWDGADATGEIRPAPSNKPEGVIENLYKLFGTVAKQTQIMEFSTLSNKASVGGHIHFEISKELKDTELNNIHKKMSSFYIPLLLGEDSVNLRIRNKSGYGKIEDYRTQNFGDARTYEFRAPSAEWITTPKVALGTLAYLATVFHEIKHNPKNLKLCKELIIKNQEQAAALHSLSVTNFVYLTQILLNRIKKFVKTFEFYPQYKKEIDFILNPDAVMKEKRKAEFNIMKGWKLEQKINLNKRELLNDTKFKKATLNIDLDNLTSAVYLPYNDDEFVGDFVRALKHRILAFNWKLKNNYFIFGLRTGIEKYIIADKNFDILSGDEQIKTKGDWSCMSNILTKMNSRFYTDNSGHTSWGKEDEDKKYILIGIPYGDRVKQNKHNFIETIYNIEKGRTKHTMIEMEKLEDSPDGKIDLACHPIQSKSELPNSAIIEDEDRTQNHIVSCSINEVIEEQRIERELIQ